MIETLLLVCSGLIGGFLILLKKNKDLESDKKLNDVKVEDAKLETKQNIIKEEKKALEKELKKIDSSKKEELNDKDIEEFWKKRQ